MPESDGWHSKDAVARYKKVIDFIVPGRREILETIARLATDFKQGTLKVLDIGCGDGAVTAEILKINNEACIDMVDYSPEMVKVSRERFQANSNIRMIQHDLNSGLPTEILNESYDAVVSCFALHHLEYEKRMPLYAAIHNILKGESLFINGDMFKGDSPVMNEWEFDNWMRWMAEKIQEHMGEETSFADIKQRQLLSFEKMGDKPGTVWDMYRDLSAAGFRYVDCMLKIQNLAVMTATK